MIPTNKFPRCQKEAKIHTAFDMTNAGLFPYTPRWGSAQQCDQNHHRPVTLEWSFAQLTWSVADCYWTRRFWFPSVFLMPAWYFSGLFLSQCSLLKRQKSSAACARTAVSMHSQEWAAEMGMGCLPAAHCWYQPANLLPQHRCYAC